MFHDRIFELSSFEICSKHKFSLSEDELGVDYGGVGREIRQLYVDNISKYFDKSENGYLLISNDKSIDFWEAFGGVMALFIVQGWKLCFKLAPFMIYYLGIYIENEIPTNKELWMYYNQINPETSLKMMNYSEIKSDGTLSNNDDVYTIIRDYLINNRFSELHSFANGFWKRIPNEPEFSWKFVSSILTTNQLYDILIGNQITCINQINFKNDNSPDSEEIILMLKDVLSEWNQEEVSNFIMFTTGDRTYNNDEIIVSSYVNSDNHLPSSSTCSKIIRIPLYPSNEILNSKLRDAIEMSKNRFDLI